MPWQTWLLKQVTSLDNVEVTVADSNAYNPGSPVTGGSNQRTLVLSNMQNTYLGFEWARQVTLGREPSLVLGDYPPWAGAVERYYMVSSDPFLVIPSCQTCPGAELLSLRRLVDCP